MIEIEEQIEQPNHFYVHTEWDMRRHDFSTGSRPAVVIR